MPSSCLRGVPPSNHPNMHFLVVPKFSSKRVQLHSTLYFDRAGRDAWDHVQQRPGFAYPATKRTQRQRLGANPEKGVLSSAGVCSRRSCSYLVFLEHVEHSTELDAIHHRISVPYSPRILFFVVNIPSTTKRVRPRKYGEASKHSTK